LWQFAVPSTITNHDSHTQLYVDAPDVEVALQKAESLGGTRPLSQAVGGTLLVGQFTDGGGSSIVTRCGHYLVNPGISARTVTSHVEQSRRDILHSVEEFSFRKVEAARIVGVKKWPKDRKSKTLSKLTRSERHPAAVALCPVLVESW
jgi:hypothetical protein